MIKKMGININIHEARVLVASVDSDKSGDLSLDEFMQLIFNDNDNLDVNLSLMPGKNNSFLKIKVLINTTYSLYYKYYKYIF